MCSPPNYIFRKKEESESRREEEEPGLSESPQLLYLYGSASTRVASRLSSDISEIIICLNSVLALFHLREFRATECSSPGTGLE